MLLSGIFNKYRVCVGGRWCLLTASHKEENSIHYNANCSSGTPLKCHYFAT